LNNLHDELWSQRKKSAAGIIAGCSDCLFQFYFAWDIIEKTALQLERGKKVFIERAVCTLTGAEIVLSIHDGMGPAFVPDQGGPRGEHAVMVDASGKGTTVENDLCIILEKILVEV